jgi:HTH-type transcriptional regulator / antitoxin HigA
MSVNATRVVGGTAAYGSMVVPNDYLAMIRQLPLLPIESADQHRRAMTVANVLLKKKVGGGKLSRGEAGYLSVLLDLLENYEKTKFPRQRVSDGEMLAHLIEAKNVTQAQVERDIGIAAPTISAVIAGRRKLTRNQIGKLAAYFHVAPTAFAFDA